MFGQMEAYSQKEWAFCYLDFQEKILEVGWSLLYHLQQMM